MNDLIKTPLYNKHLELGATFGESFGCKIPFHYGNPVDEYKALRNGAGIFDCSHLGKLEFTGADVDDYLQRMTSSDLNNLEPGKGCLNTLLTDRGKLISDFRHYKLEDRVRMDLVPIRKKEVYDLFEKFIIMDDVAIKDISSEFGVVGIYGPNSRSILCSLFKLDLPPLNEYSHFEAFYSGLDLMVTYTRFTGDEGYEIWAPEEMMSSLWDDLLTTAEAHSTRPVGFEALNITRIEAGIPILGIDMDGTTIPLEAALDHAVSVTKGCYIGQEIISRIHHLGHVNRRLSGLKFKGDLLPEIGDLIKEGDRKIGTVTSAVYSPALQCGIGLTILRREFLEPGRALTVISDKGPIESTVNSLPFV